MGKQTSDFEFLKKHYGENFAKFCRANFSSVLEKEGLLSKIIEENFPPSRALYEDLVIQGQQHQFINYITSYVPEFEIKYSDVKVKETPEELMKKAGYTLYQCKSNKDVQSFKKYYKSDEELCTFRDPHRINSHHIFFAVKDNVESIKRQNFNNPQRQDEYGTSVISIQFNKTSGTISIKNRYNHTVNNPDATFGNNLENIIPGLTNSFVQHYNLSVANSTEPLELDGYAIPLNGGWYKYNYEIVGGYCCENNIYIKDGRVLQFDKNRYILMNQFLIDKESKTIINITEYDIKTNSQDKKLILNKDNFSLTYKGYDEYRHDSFVDLYNNIEKIEVTKGTNGERLIQITNNGQISYVTIDKSNRIIKYQNDYIEEVRDNFFQDVDSLKCVTAKNLKSVGNRFCFSGKNITDIDFPKLEQIGGAFLYYSNIPNVSLPNVKSVGFNFIGGGKNLKFLSAPLLESVGNGFLKENTNMQSISLPNLKNIGNYFMEENENILDVNLPSVESIGHDFLLNAVNIKKISLPNVEKINDCFMRFCNLLEEVYLPKVKEIGDSFLTDNINIKDLELPNCEIVARYFLKNNESLQKLIAPKLNQVGKYFLEKNKSLRTLALPNLEKIDINFLQKNKHIKNLIVPKLNLSMPKENTNRKIAHLIKRQIKLKKKLEEKEK